MTTISTIGSVGNYIVSNLLDELGMSPAWGKIRKYVYAMSVVVSLYPLYLVFGLTLKCHPAYLNGTLKDGEASSEYVNIYCRNVATPFAVKYAGCFLQLSNVINLLTSFFWLHKKEVMESFRTFAEIRTKVLEMNLPLQNMKDLLLSSNSSIDCDKRSKLRKCCRLLNFLTKCNHVYKWYRIRNWLVLIGIGISTGALIWLADSINESGDTFMCSCEGNRLDTHKCVIDCVVALCIFTSLFLIGLLVQGALVGFGIWQTWRKCAQAPYPSVELILLFSKYSEPLNSELLGDFLHYLLSEQFHNDITKCVRDIVRNEDLEMIEILESFTKSPPPAI